MKYQKKIDDVRNLLEQGICFVQKKNGKILLFLILSLYIFSPQQTQAQDLSEYDVKAGYIFKFIYFVNWPENTFQKSESTINFAIVGENPFGDSFKKIMGKTINGNVLVIDEIKTDDLISNSSKYQIIFICSSELKQMSRILKTFDGKPVLTISDIDSFLDKNGMINFIVREGNIRFEINDSAIKNAGLNIRSAMKRQAVRIIGEDDGG